jgi:threonine/homoserine/homoserine lactone efflux protein
MVIRLGAVCLAYVAYRAWRRRPPAVSRAAETPHRDAPSPWTMAHVGAATAPSEEVAPELFRNT